MQGTEDEDLSSLKNAIDRRVERADFKAEIVKKSAVAGDMGVLDEGISFVSEHRELIEEALSAFLVWLEARLGRTSTWTVSNGKRTVQVEATKLDRRARESIAQLLADEDDTDEPGN
ncbi:hypothetical protein [Streptomyces sp. NBC_01483]|uniref:hypothetical protein n=1 Tax=Streptomyces sp. NBC_01483 TaxID=2903883 RepID=UPI002E369A6B|nr:hypothetical protein [Streptomyces sp. NBC_01483]